MSDAKKRSANMEPEEGRVKKKMKREEPLQKEEIEEAIGGQSTSKATQYESIFVSSFPNQRPTPALVKVEWEKKKFRIKTTKKTSERSQKTGRFTPDGIEYRRTRNSRITNRVTRYEVLFHKYSQGNARSYVGQDFEHPFSENEISTQRYQRET